MHTFPVRIYYEDTDFTGVVYHANYLKYFERAREHLLGPEVLVALWDEDGVGFAVYKATLQYREGARHGDLLEVRSTVQAPSDYRLTFHQAVWRPDGARPLVEAEIDLVCVGRDFKLVRVPKRVLELVAAGGTAAP